MNLEQARFNMIEQQIRPWNVLDAQILELLGAVRREAFVPAPYRSAAFMDTELPLGDGQIMLEPKVEARMVQELELKAHERVLEIGAGSGFVAALLGHRAREVITLEIRPQLAEMAERNLRRSGPANVHVRLCDASGPLGSVAPGTFDAVLVSGAVASVPESLLKLLNPGGRLVTIEGKLPIMRAVRWVRGSGSDDGQRTELFDTVAPLLDGFAPPTRFRF